MTGKFDMSKGSQTIPFRYDYQKGGFWIDYIPYDSSRYRDDNHDASTHANLSSTNPTHDGDDDSPYLCPLTARAYMAHDNSFIDDSLTLRLESSH